MQGIVRRSGETMMRFAIAALTLASFGAMFAAPKPPAQTPSEQTAKKEKEKKEKKNKKQKQTDTKQQSFR
jgi:hypothetical protein